MDRAEKVSSIVLIAFGLFVAYYSRQYLKLGMMITPGAGFLPYWIGIALVVLGAIWFFKTFLARAGSGAGGQESDAGDAAAEGKALRGRILTKFLPGVLLVILYAWLFEKAGYIVSSALFMVGWQKVVEKEGWLKTAVIAVLSAGGMYALFSYLLKVYLPTGTWFS
ncbi:MAG: tripartite tricarboxylate transporter TctB family protein [Candidatus Deferrimicrobiaceae bacterium]